MSVINIKKQKQNILKKVSIKKKTKKSLILRIHDIVEPLPDFLAQPANREVVPSVCELDQFLRGILQILKKERCILYNYRVKAAKNGKVLIPEDFHTAHNCNYRFVSDWGVCFKVSSSLSLTNFKKVDQKSKFCAIFDEKSLNFENFIKNFSQKNFNQTIQQRSSISIGNNNTLPLRILTYFELN